MCGAGMLGSSEIKLSIYLHISFLIHGFMLIHELYCCGVLMELKGGGLLLEYMYWSSCTTVAWPSYLIWFCVRLFCIRYRGSSITGLTALMAPQTLACLINCTIDWSSREEMEKDARFILLCLFWGSRCKCKGEVIRSELVRSEWLRLSSIIWVMPSPVFILWTLLENSFGPCLMPRST